jgi:replicative DNA helicase Mcm
MDKIIKSIVPSIHVYEIVKKALAFQLFSGIRKYLPDGTVLRGNIHIVLIGDPGIAKSQLLRKVIHISPRGVFISGKTSSAAGLTVAVVKDALNGGWTLEGGAAVMASGGILAFDEIGQIREEDKSSLHEVMEQDTVNMVPLQKILSNDTIE